MTRRSKTKEFAVIGLGRFGSSLARKLEMLGHSVLGIDERLELVQELAHELTQAVALDATSEEALRAVDIASFETVIVAIGDDFEANLLTTTGLKELGVAQVICKSNTERQGAILRRVGADRVLQPEQDGGEQLAMELSMPLMIKRVPIGEHHSIAEVVLPKSLAAQSLAKSDLRNKHNVTVLVIRRDDSLIVSPPPDTIFQPDDILILLGANEHLISFGAKS